MKALTPEQVAACVPDYYECPGMIIANVAEAYNLNCLPALKVSERVKALIKNAAAQGLITKAFVKNDIHYVREHE